METETIQQAPQIGNRTGSSSSLPKPKNPRGAASLPAQAPAQTETPAATTVIETPAPPVEAPAAPQAPAVTAPVATTETPSPQATEQPKAAPQASVTHEIDPTANYKLPNGRIVSGKTLQWEEGLLKKHTKVMNEANAKEQNLQEIVQTAVNAALAAAPQASTTIAAPQVAQFSEPEPQMPQGVYEDSKEMKDYEKAHSSWSMRKTAFDASMAAMQPYLQQQQQEAEKANLKRQQEEVYQHNWQLIDSLPVVLENLTGIDFNALSKESKLEVLHRLETSARHKGVEVRLTSPNMIAQDIARISGRLNPDTLEAIAAMSFTDGWRPGIVEQAPIPTLSPAAQAVAEKIQNKEPLVDKADPPPPLLPVEASGTPEPNSAVAQARRNGKEKYAKFLGEAK